VVLRPAGRGQRPTRLAGPPAEEWAASSLPWDSYRRSWAEHEHCHTGQAILRELDARFDRRVCERSPYFFHDLAGTADTAEQGAIDAGLIQATGIRYAASRPSRAVVDGGAPCRARARVCGCSGPASCLHQPQDERGEDQLHGQLHLPARHDDDVWP
jgi:hypothetical protein